MQRLRGAIRQYPWGSRTKIAELLGDPSPSPHPQAELWLGAHPGDPAWVMSGESETTLLDFLRSDPPAALGSRITDRFGSELPFLMKVIAADEPLSLQAHPDIAQARRGYDREQRLGTPVTASNRNYKDPRHKPEVVIALEPFEALAGFRPVAQTRKLLQEFAIADVPGQFLLDSPSERDALRALFTTWLCAPPPRVASMIAAIRKAATSYLLSGAVEFAAEAHTLIELGDRYPGDPGVLAALLLNRVTLTPGDALYLPAGNLHAYLRGVGVEVMANSDNVLRGGLTSKHIDVIELLAVLDFTPIAPAALRPPIHRVGRRVSYAPPVDEFAVSMWTLGDTDVGREMPVLQHDSGPHIMLCAQGAVTITDRGSTVSLRRGDATWISADDCPVCLRADTPATVFTAGVPRA